jgi:hypothetical protein
VVAAVIAIAATVAASVLAGVGGVLAVSITHRAAASDGLNLTALAIGAALLGGTSAYGRRGGIFGTVLAVGLITVTGQYLNDSDRSWGDAALAAVAIGVGLAVTRLVERFGRPETAAVNGEEEWAPAGHAAPSSSHATRSWRAPASTTTTTTATTTGGLWASDDAWGSTEHR